MNIKVRYGAQALAIVMIVIVVAIVIGMAMLSRTLRDQQLTVQEQTSAEALELSDSIIDVIKGTTVDELIATCTNPEYGAGVDSPDGCQVKGESEVVTFLTELGVSSNVLDGFDGCTDNASDLDIDIRLATFEDDLEVRPDTVRSFVLGETAPNPLTCSLDLQFEARGTNNAGVMISKIYGKDYVDGIATEYKEYAYDDASFFCINSSGGCPDGSLLSGSWANYDPDSIMSIALNDVINGYKLDEVRVRPINGVVAVSSELSSKACIPDTEMVKITVAANCAGTYRAKSIQLPQQEWGLPIFDYVLYNGTGVLQPE